MSKVGWRIRSTPKIIPLLRWSIKRKYLLNKDDMVRKKKGGSRYNIINEVYEGILGRGGPPADLSLLLLRLSLCLDLAPTWA